MSRVFRHITQEQRTTILTMIVVHLDQLDVVRHALLLPGETQLAAGIRENVELFSLSVMPPLFEYLSHLVTPCHHIYLRGRIVLLYQLGVL